MNWRTRNQEIREKLGIEPIADRIRIPKIEYGPNLTALIDFIRGIHASDNAVALMAHYVEHRGASDDSLEAMRWVAVNRGMEGTLDELMELWHGEVLRRLIAFDKTLPGPNVKPSKGTDDDYLISAQHPDADLYRCKQEWCTAEWAKGRYGLGQSAISKAHTQARGIHKCKIAPPRTAMVNGRRLQVFKLNDLVLLADARNRANDD